MFSARNDIHSAPASAALRRVPQDQADGLRRLFAARQCALLPLAANPHGASSPRVLDRLAAVLASQGHHVLVVDAASTSPLPHELAAVDLSACVLNVAPRVSYLAARGLPMDHVDTRGSCAGFAQAVQEACPQAGVVLMHADGIDLARMLKPYAVRPLLLAADHPESIKHAYANAKLLARRCELLSYDLLLVASGQSPRLRAIADSLGACLDTFLGAVLRGTALIDPNGPAGARASADLARLLSAQLALAVAPAAPAAVGPATLGRDFRTEPRLDARSVSRPEFR